MANMDDIEDDDYLDLNPNPSSCEDCPGGCDGPRTRERWEQCEAKYLFIRF